MNSKVRFAFLETTPTRFVSQSFAVVTWAMRVFLEDYHVHQQEFQGVENFDQEVVRNLEMGRRAANLEVRMLEVRMLEVRMVGGSRLVDRCLE